MWTCKTQPLLNKGEVGLLKEGIYLQLGLKWLTNELIKLMSSHLNFITNIELC